MSTITNISNVTDLSGETPIVTYSNPVTTVINDPPAPPCACCDCCCRYCECCDCCECDCCYYCCNCRCCRH